MSENDTGLVLQMAAVLNSEALDADLGDLCDVELSLVAAGYRIADVERLSMPAIERARTLRVIF